MLSLFILCYNMPSREVNIMLVQKMITQLKIKQGNNTVLTQEELEWLWENIGNPNPEIRDDLVFNLFGQFIFEQLITKEQ